MRHRVYVFALILVVFCSIACERGELARTIRPATDERTQQQAALSVIRRLIHERTDNVAIKVNFKLPVNYFKLRKTNNSAVLRIEASSGVAATKAFHHYLKHYCNAHISWDGHQLSTLAQLTDFPPVNVEATASSKIIYYQNVCTHSYSFSFWQWRQWREHIDWIALSGVTLTLAPFQEDVWTDIYREYGMSQAEIDEHLAGVGFFAWQRMGNIRGWGGRLSRNFIDYASDLQRQMIAALNELGIAVAIQAFDGHLPVHFKSIFPNASFSTTTQWNDFPPRYCCPLFIEPTDQLFSAIGEKFLRAMIAKYGSNHVYFSDPFNEVQPRIADATYLRNVSLSIYAGMRAVDANAIWLLQGWFLVNNAVFWREELTRAFLTAVPSNKLLILDLQSEQHPQYNFTRSFYGQPFIWCMLHNFGGTSGMHGSIRLVNAEIPRAASMENSSMVGVGITPEGIHQNYIVYQFALEKAWAYGEINHKRWTRNYARSRYGIEAEEALEHVWLLLLKSVYAFESARNIRGKYVYCRRPSLRIQTWRWYDEKYVTKALGRMLAGAESSVLNRRLYERDLVDLTRQFLQIRAENIYVQLVESFKKKRAEQFAHASELFLELLRDLDALLATHDDFLLGRFLEAAKAMATNAQERTQYEFNARNQITLWGPSGQIVDYATKQWNGIVLDYYYPRWSLFIQQLNVSLQTRVAFNQSKFQSDVFEQVEHPFNLDTTKLYPTEANGSAVAKATELYEKWQTISLN